MEKHARGAAMGHEGHIVAAGVRRVTAHRVDQHVGRRLRERRWLMGLTLEAVAAPLGIKAQQIQKYETATNRISASRLWELAELLEVPVAYFFEGLPARSQATVAGGAWNEREALTDKEAAALVRAFGALPESQRRRLLDLARALGPAA